MKSSELIREHYDEIIKAIIALEKSDPRYQVDLYLYPDGSTEEYTNVGGNSWWNDDHIGTIYSCNHEYWDDDWQEDMEDWMWQEQAEEILNNCIAECEDWERAEEILSDI